MLVQVCREVREGTVKTSLSHKVTKRLSVGLNY